MALAHRFRRYVEVEFLPPNHFHLCHRPRSKSLPQPTLFHLPNAVSARNLPSTNENLQAFFVVVAVVVAMCGVPSEDAQPLSILRSPPPAPMSLVF